jgi:hypothetical protein
MRLLPNPPRAQLVFKAKVTRPYHPYGTIHIRTLEDGLDYAFFCLGGCQWKKMFQVL